MACDRFVAWFCRARHVVVIRGPGGSSFVDRGNRIAISHRSVLSIRWVVFLSTCSGHTRRLRGCSETSATGLSALGAAAAVFFACLAAAFAATFPFMSCCHPRCVSLCAVSCASAWSHAPHLSPTLGMCTCTRVFFVASLSGALALQAAALPVAVPRCFFLARREVSPVDDIYWRSWVFCLLAPAALDGLFLFQCISVFLVAIVVAGVLLASQYLRAVGLEFWCLHSTVA